MRIITSVGYYGTGSSAVTDFLKEFSTVSLAGRGEYEIRFVQDPDGISDLYHNVIENNHRHNTSNSIKRFKKYIDYLNGDFYTKRYRKFFGENFKKISYDYIDSLTSLKAVSWCHLDQYNRGRFFTLFDICYSIIFKKIKKAKERQSLLQKKELGYYTYITEEEFLRKTKDYLDKLFDEANVKNTDNIIVEQMLPPSNIDRYIKFFNDLKVVVVDRDPRDVYIITKEIYKGNIIPVGNVSEFCHWFKIIREHRKHESFDNALLIQFEDLVYKYEETTQKIVDYVGLNKNNHIEKQKYFDPSKSIKGTKIFTKFPQYKKDIEYIEAELKEYIYEYGE